MRGMRLITVAWLVAALAGCGGRGPSAPGIGRFQVVAAWTPALGVSLEVSAGQADLAAISLSSVAADGSLGREIQLLGSPVGPPLAGQRRVTASIAIPLGQLQPTSRLRLRAVDAVGREAVAFTSVERPGFVTAGGTCSEPSTPCAGELACVAGRCAVPAAAEAACAAAAEVAWTTGGAATLPAPVGPGASFLGRCSAPDPRADTVHRLEVTSPEGEHLELTLPAAARAILRTDCLAPASEYRCLDASGGVDLEAGTYALILQCGEGCAGEVSLTASPLPAPPP